MEDVLSRISIIGSKTFDTMNFRAECCLELRRIALEPYFEMT